MDQQRATTPRRRRPSQADVARLAGVSQATVSLVVNGRTDGNVQIGTETRDRILAAVRELGYVANPAARNLAGGRNRLLGVYTFESVFPTGHNDFYHPFFLGIEREAEARGYDLVLFTSATGADGRRSLYRDGVNRLALADGCVLLGKRQARGELTRLVREGFPFVFVGRREVPGAGIDYVAADYVAATAEVVGRLAALGHHRLAYVGIDRPIEPDLDRERGYREGHEAAGTLAGPAVVHRLAVDGIDGAWLRARLGEGVTALLAEDGDVADALAATAAGLGVEVPGHLSLALLGMGLERATAGRAWTGFRIPREEMGRQAVAVLVETLATGPGGDAGPRQVVLPCAPVVGETAAAPPAGAAD